MNNSLRPYQKDAVEFLIDTDHAALFADCGLGKSRIALEVIHNLQLKREIAKVLIVAPLRVARLQWPLEIEKWDHLKYMNYRVLHGPKKERRLHEKADVYIINYDGIKWLYETCRTLGIQPFDMLILDESTKVKNPTAKRTKMLQKFRNSVMRTVCMTGTPSPQGVVDFFSQIRMLDKGQRLGKSFHAFRNFYFNCYDPMGYTYVPKKTAEADIKDKIADICMYIDTADHLALHEPEFRDVEVVLPEDIQKQYKELEKKYFIDLDNGSVDAINSAVLSNKLLQFAGGAVYDDKKQVVHVHDRKMAMLTKNFYLIDTPVLIVYTYHHERERLKKAFPEAIDFRAMSSDTCRTADKEILRRWNDKKIEIMLCHPASCGHGLNLQYGGSTVIYFSLPWSYELYHQMNKRIDRPGQENAPVFHRLIVKDTIEEVVVSTLERKETDQKSILKALAKYREEL